tara:strand:- start:59 stop:625 length:567 start_codon:yes stop_codon:yes gene_type:complete
MTFLQTLVEQGVTLSRFTSVLLLLASTLWIVPAGVYTFGLFHALDADDPVAVLVLWSLNVGFHGIVGLLTAVDAFFVQGLFWPLQAVIIGLALFNTISLSTLSSHYIATNDTIGVGLSLGALGHVCLANGTMVAIVFELFHRRQLHRAQHSARRGPHERVPQTRSSVVVKALEAKRSGTRHVRQPAPP